MECSPINGSLKNLILISDSVFSKLFSFLQFILSFKYDLTTWSIILRGTDSTGEFFKILKIFVKTCPGIINTIHSIHQRFD